MMKRSTKPAEGAEDPQSNSVTLCVRSERGVALIIALMAILFMMALGGALMLSTTTETRIANNFRNRLEALYAADAGLERSLADLATISDWDAILTARRSRAFNDGAPGARALADGTTLDVNQILAFANCQRPACTTPEYSAVTIERPWGANNPRWLLFAYGWLDDMSPSRIDSPFYVVVMVADDQSENDGDPLRDGADATNPGSGILALRAEAFGPFGVRQAVELTVARATTGDPLGGSAPSSNRDTGIGRPGVRILSWREVR